ncbi:hypothetical protein F4781DRAFT_390881 [Annulohypoxylon bovei var. microspora]|nr:hypothetical protein F4781DRAFT_390881 [Annulohypoxylon bovei var. microspora]
MSNQYPNYYGLYYTDDQDNDCIFQDQNFSLSSQELNVSYQDYTSPSQYHPPSGLPNQHPIPDEGSSSQPKSSNILDSRKPHSCQDPGTCTQCKRKARAASGRCEYVLCNNLLSPSSTRRCKDHLKQGAIKSSASNKRRAERNRCKICSENADPGRTLCAKHLESERKRKQRARQPSRASTSTGLTGLQPTISSSYGQSDSQSWEMVQPWGQQQPSNDPQSNLSQAGYYDGATQSQNRSHYPSQSQYYGSFQN